jgi:hypothetical protein
MAGTYSCCDLKISWRELIAVISFYVPVIGMPKGQICPVVGMVGPGGSGVPPNEIATLAPPSCTREAGSRNGSPLPTTRLAKLMPEMAMLV